MKSTSEYIADEIMDTIERERRINRDDLILAVDNAIAKRERALKAANPIIVAEPQVYNTGVTPVLTTWGDALISPHVHTFMLPKDNTSSAFLIQDNTAIKIGDHVFHVSGDGSWMKV